MTIHQAYNIVKSAAELAPINKEAHRLVDVALKLIEGKINETLKPKEEAPSAQ